jgi:hypothetical protein
MNREEAYDLLVSLKKASRLMCVSEPLALVHAAIASGGKQQGFVHDVLAFLEECEEADYDKTKALLTSAIDILNKNLRSS